MSECTKEGLIKKEGFNPSAQKPPETAHGRPKHNDPMIKRKTQGAKKGK